MHIAEARTLGRVVTKDARRWHVCLFKSDPNDEENASRTSKVGIVGRQMSVKAEGSVARTHQQTPSGPIDPLGGCSPRLTLSSGGFLLAFSAAFTLRNASRQGQCARASLDLGLRAVPVRRFYGFRTTGGRPFPSLLSTELRWDGDGTVFLVDGRRNGGRRRDARVTGSRGSRYSKHGSFPDEYSSAHSRKNGEALLPFSVDRNIGLSVQKFNVPSDQPQTWLEVIWDMFLTPKFQLIEVYESDVVATAVTAVPLLVPSRREFGNPNDGPSRDVCFGHALYDDCESPTPHASLSSICVVHLIAKCWERLPLRIVSTAARSEFATTGFVPRVAVQLPVAAKGNSCNAPPV
ncbi:hypothetical protein C8R45DRAFT_927740 [Mycena sanguinolenta]|nr:hypothetical protein C8R45DRAFT_927740 [Mycena sanguinolenta]